MPSFVQSLLRDAVQKLLGIVFAWVGVHFIAIPEDEKKAITNWAVLGATALLLLIWTALVRFLESRNGNSQLDAYCRAIGRVLMLGIKTTPVYVTPTPPAAATPAPEGTTNG